MRIDRYHMTIYGLVVLSLLLIVVLSLALYNNGPRVRLVQFEYNPQETSLLKDSNITVSFDRPLEQMDYSQSISFEPEVEFTSQTNSQNIIIRLNENLVHNTNYSLILDSEIIDQTGKNMRSKYQHSFITSEPSYAYLERNYGSGDGAFNDPGANDHIKKDTIGGGEEILFSHPEINTFAINDSYLIVAVNGESKDQMFTINLKTGEVREVQILLKGRVSNLQISPRGKIALFTLVPDFDPDEQQLYVEYAKRVQSLNVETGQIETIVNSNGESIRANDIFFDESGQVAIVRDLANDFYAISPFNDYEPVLIGSFVSSFGFFNNSSIIFRSSDGLVVYDIDTGTSKQVEPGFNGYIEVVDNAGSDLFVFSANYQTGEQVGQIEEINSNFDSLSVVWLKGSQDDFSLKGMSVSYDGTILALQINPDDCLFDSVPSNTQCEEVETILYNVETKSEITRYPGFSTVWLP